MSRVFDVSNLGKQNAVSSALQDGLQTGNLLAQYDDQKRRKILNKQADEDRVRGLQDQAVQRERGNILFDNQLADRDRDIERQAISDQMAQESHSSLLEQRSLQGEMSRSQNARANKSSAQQDAKHQEWMNSSEYRKKEQDLSLKIQRANLSSAEGQNQLQAFQAKEAERQDRIRGVNDLMVKAQAMTESGAKPAELNKVFSEISEKSGINISKLDEHTPIVEEFVDKLGSGEWKIDSPEAQEAIRVVVDPLLKVSGRSGDWAYANVVPSGEREYSIQMKDKDGKEGYITYAQGSGKQEVVQGFDAPGLMQSAQGYLQTSKEVNAIRNAYNPQPQKEQAAPKWKESSSGELYNENSATRPEMTGAAGGAANPQQKILDNLYGEDANVDDQMVYGALKQAGMGSRKHVEAAKAFAEKEKMSVEDAAPVYMQLETNKVQSKALMADLLAEPELAPIKKRIKKIVESELKKSGGNKDTIIQKVLEAKAAYDLREEGRAKKAEKKSEKDAKNKKIIDKGLESTKWFEAGKLGELK